MSDKPSISQQAQGSYIAEATGGSTATVQVVLPPASGAGAKPRALPETAARLL